MTIMLNDSVRNLFFFFLSSVQYENIDFRRNHIKIADNYIKIVVSLYFYLEG
jgi:hypothetical protein